MPGERVPEMAQNDPKKEHFLDIKNANLADVIIIRSLINYTVAGRILEIFGGYEPCDIICVKLQSII